MVRPPRIEVGVTVPQTSSKPQPLVLFAYRRSCASSIGFWPLASRYILTLGSGITYRLG